MRLLTRLFPNGLAIIVAAWFVPGLRIVGPRLTARSSLWPESQERKLRRRRT